MDFMESLISTTKDSYTMQVIFCNSGCGGLLFEVEKGKLWYCFACGAFNYRKAEHEV
jgi:hypothetical protein